MSVPQVAPTMPFDVLANPSKPLTLVTKPLTLLASLLGPPRRQKPTTFFSIFEKLPEVWKWIEF